MRRILLMASVLLVSAVWLAMPVAALDIDAGFNNPPASAKPHTWWHWVNGNISEEGITADLEAMASAGIGGAQIFNVGLIPEKGPVPFMSPEWRWMLVHAVKEANRLGIEIAMHNCDGWSSSGGPWNTPENAMQMAVWSETPVSGPGALQIRLPQPFTRLGYYKDAAVVAFPVPAAETPNIRDAVADAKVGEAAFVDAALLWDGDAATCATLTAPNAGSDAILDLIMKSPLTASSLTILPAPTQAGSVDLQVSDDGQTFRSVCKIPIQGQAAFAGNRPDWAVVSPFPAVTGKVFRLVFEKPADGAVPVGEISFGGMRLDGLAVKSGARMGNPATLANWPATPDGVAIAPESVVDLTSLMQPDGSLSWNAPEGQWIVLRFGHSAIGVNNHPSSESGRGLECDKLSKPAVKAHFDAAIAPLIQDLGPLAGKTLNQLLIDSYETGPQNWTPAFPADFAARRGYSLISWLPTFTGRIVGSIEQSERFFWDVRRTIAQLWADNYVGYFGELARANGMLLGCEAYGDGGFNELECASRADIPMSEFWCGQDADWGVAAQMGSISHIMGKSILGAEAFTSGGDGWRFDPFSLKRLGDLEYCAGVNRFIFHTYAHQSTDERMPGMALGPHGFHFQRHNTLWPYLPAWFTYMTRSQFLLQAGEPQTDLCLLAAENDPGTRTYDSIPEGYGTDRCPAELLMTATAENGLLRFPSGKTYSVLVLSGTEAMTLELITKIRELVEGGVVLYGSAPSKAPGLTAYPNSDLEVKARAMELWGSAPAAQVENRCGKGTVVWGTPLEDLVKRLVPFPAFSYEGDGVRLLSIKRRVGDADIFFVSNQMDGPVTTDCTFRAVGEPEFWDPATGLREDAVIYHRNAGTTTIPLQMERRGSMFVVFRPESKDPGAGVFVEATRDGGPLNPQPKASSLVVKKAVYGLLDDPAKCVDVTDKVAALARDGRLEFIAGNSLAGDPAGMQLKQFRIDYVLDGKDETLTTGENAYVILPHVAGDGIPSAEFLRREGQTILRAWQAGSYSLKDASGKTAVVQVDSIPEPAPVNGPWRVSFTGMSAPPPITLNELISWTEHPDADVQHFSGIGLYTTTFDAPVITPDARIILDLGDLRSMGKVSVNGFDFGVVWKAPWRLDITTVIRPGRNELRVEAANTWLNRLIGDQQLPEDQRKTWVPWPVCGPHDPLMESGLLGPVVLRTVRDFSVGMPR